ncbi:MAG: hypothetical protein JNL64_14135 [Blastocatellia bacterium]|nr:hypothetical protein [Blastocatellia bacterium]
MNTLYHGDNLNILREYIKDESVELIYLDPPSISKRNYNQIYNNIGTLDRSITRDLIANNLTYAK